jgi:uncharacterized membrane protein
VILASCVRACREPVVGGGAHRLSMPGLAYLHVVSALIFLGGMVFIAGLLVPSARRLGEAGRTLQTIGQVVKIVHPVLLASLGILIVTGAAMLTDLKAALGSRYFSQLFAALGSKLLVVFILALLSSYQFFRLGLPLTRSMAEESGAPARVPPDRMAALLRSTGRLQGYAWTSAALGGVAAALGVALRHGW